MSLIEKLGEILADGKNKWENAKPLPLNVVEEVSSGCNDECSVGGRKDDGFADGRMNDGFADGRKSHASENMLIRGDNLGVMKQLISQGYGGKLRLIYGDPPFNSKVDYDAKIKLASKGEKSAVSLPAMRQTAYSDSWEYGQGEYLSMLTARLYGFHELLADDGGIWIHLDWHAVHYVKIIMDEIFGEENFVNEVIWQYKSGGGTKRRFSRKHDTLLYYGKTRKYFFCPQREKSYNRGLKPYNFKGVEEFQDEVGWYTMVNMKDVWQMDMVGRTSAERTGYATQKPEALLNRILLSCTEEGDLVADFFGGSGTLAAAAQKTGRQWLYCDAGRLASSHAQQRLVKEKAQFCIFNAGNRNVSQDKAKQFTEITDELTPEIAVIKGDDGLYQIELVKVKLNSNAEMPVIERHKDEAAKLAKKTPMSFIEYMSIDASYDGKLFKPQAHIFKDDNPKGWAWQTERLGSVVAVRVIDVFGNSGMAYMQIDEGR